MVTRRRYSKEFKAEAISLVVEQKLSIAQVCQDLDIGISTMDRWVRDYKKRAADPNALSEADYEELKRLRKENNVLKLERDFLKKTAAYFAKTTVNGAKP